MNTDTAGNPIPLVPAYCGRCGGPADTGGQCAVRCLGPMTRPAFESDVEQALGRDVIERLRGLGSVPLAGLTAEGAFLLRGDVLKLLADHERQAKELERLRAAALEVVAEYKSHGGPRTHRECLVGCGCVLPATVDALAAALEAKPE